MLWEGVYRVKDPFVVDAASVVKKIQSPRSARSLISTCARKNSCGQATLAQLKFFEPKLKTTSDTLARLPPHSSSLSFRPFSVLVWVLLECCHNQSSPSRTPRWTYRHLQTVLRHPRTMLGQAATMPRQLRIG